MQLSLDKRWTNRLKGRLECYEFEAGVLNDKDYRMAKPKSAGLSSIAGGPARKASSKSSGKKVSEVSKFFRQGFKNNYLNVPFQGEGKNKDIIAFTREFMKYAFGHSKEKRLINLLQAIIRNPLARGDYGPNAPSTIRRKGFNRYGIDTGQLFKSITARVRKVR